MTIRQKFIRDWGKDTYSALITAAESHGNGVNDATIGDITKWALLIAIGFQCMSSSGYREYHKFPKLNWLKMKRWIKDNAELSTYRGDFDYLAAACGAYNYYLKK